ncbi:ethanolamine utilization protein EutJ [Clostridium polyendosporum]|uniref:Ethanolamine utilization protein EutJ n=1 Tax=Clostridium polyendosporum TaxID=69208 RepID=A0A919RY03_9CLOT|nr:ABC transporter substrate-binding protein [Clostridium polyendosporum]GIM28595.1 ethanolamine utilization protein EutJ [Clostridium polyendosporum]
MKKRLLGSIMVLTLAGSLFVGCSKNELKESDVIKIGGIAPLTGKVATYGQSVKDAVLLAEEEINNKGGINGKKVKVVYEDDQAEQNAAINAFNKLVDDEKVVAILGPVTSGATLAVAPKATQNKIPLLTPTATEPNITKIGGDFVFRGCYVDSFQGSTMAKFAAKDLEKKTAAILYNIGSDYSKGIAESFKKDFEAQGGKVLELLSYNNGDKDFNAQLTKVKTANPDVLFLPDYFDVAALAAKQARELGVKSQFLGVDGWDAEDLYNIAGDAIKGGLFINHYFQGDPAKEVQDFVTAYKGKYNKEPDALAALGYDAAKTLFKAIEDAKSADGDKIREALTKIQITGVTGKQSFGEDRTAVKGAVILKVEGEKRSLVKKINP